ncbi:MAG: (E)-4-hydroxy-3-methylbut-2-enyl-diphosphate synthase [Verrucomicrobiales bacterium]
MIPFQTVQPSNRRVSRPVHVGSVQVGGNAPVVVQSMITCDTMDTEASIAESKQLAEAGCQIVRITAPTIHDARNLEHIRAGLKREGCHVPLVADIHFKPQAALEAAKWVDKVRVNPGNYADSKKFAVREYSDQEYEVEVARVAELFRPLVELCQQRGISIRIGCNHGSLSDRIMNRFGDTPAGMVESAMEFARAARDLGFHDFLFSMKASNPKVMIAAYRLLVTKLAEAGPDWNYPIHLGVTEAGDGEDGRIKSAIGIGSLLCDGVGDTVRVSLTEDSIHEIPVARRLVELAEAERTVGQNNLGALAETLLPFDPFVFERRPSLSWELIPGLMVGGAETVRVGVRPETWGQLAHKLDRMGDFAPEFRVDEQTVVSIDPRDDAGVQALGERDQPCLVTVKDGLELPVIPAFRLLAARIPIRHSILLKDTLQPSTNTSKPFLDSLLVASMNIGALLCDGIGDAILVQGEEAPGQSLRLAYNILQSTGVRIFKTDYVACPSCGRTLFNLQTTTARIKEATVHLKGVRIAVMGCIVNGPGEMADADFGYVGGAPGKVNLYVGKKAVKFNIPEAEAVDRLVDLIKEHGKWVDAPIRAEVVEV